MAPWVTCKFRLHSLGFACDATNADLIATVRGVNFRSPRHAVTQGQRVGHKANWEHTGQCGGASAPQFVRSRHAEWPRLHGSSLCVASFSGPLVGYCLIDGSGFVGPTARDRSTGQLPIVRLCAESLGWVNSRVACRHLDEQALRYGDCTRRIDC